MEIEILATERLPAILAILNCFHYMPHIVGL